MKKKYIIIITIIFIVAAASVAFIFKSTILKRFSPDKYMETVFINTINGFSREIIKIPDTTSITDGIYKFSLTLGLKDYKMDWIPEDFKYTMEALKLLTITSDSVIDRKNRKLVNDIRILAGGIGLTDFQTFFTDEMYAVQCEMLTDKTITINPKTFVSDWNSSPVLAPLTNLTIPDVVNVNGLNNFIFSDKSIYKNTNDELQLRIKDETVQFIKSCEVMYLGQEDSLDLVEATYSKESLNMLYNLYANAVITKFDDSLQAYLKLASDYDAAHVALNLIEDYKRNILNISFDEDLTVTYFIDNNVIKRVVTNETGILYGSNSVKAQMNVDLPGKAYLSDIVNIELNLTGYVNMSVNLSNILTNSDSKQLHQDLSVHISENGNNSSHRYIVDWTPEDSGNFNLSYLYDSDINKINFSLSDGQLIADNNEISLKNAILSAGYNENKLEVKTGCTIKKHDGNVDFDDSNAFSIFDINIFELNSIYMKAQNFLYSF